MADSIASTSASAQPPLNGVDEGDVGAGQQAADSGASSSIPAQTIPNGGDEIVEEALQAADSIVPSSASAHTDNSTDQDLEAGQQAAGDDIAMAELYHAIFFIASDAAQKIEEADDNHLLNCGPNGQNALHVAALRSNDLTKKVLDKQENLRNRADSSENIPLHFAASVGVKGVIETLLDRGDKSNLTTKDSKEMCPIHIAASVGAVDAVRALIRGENNHDYSPAALRDANGGTFVHVAVANKKTNVVKFACREPRQVAFLDIFLPPQPKETFRDILNAKDNDGNTALHLAVQNTDVSSFWCLVGNKHVELNLVNNEGYTPLDLASKIKITNPFASLKNPTEWMIRVLAHSGAYFSPRSRCDSRFGIMQMEDHVPLALKKTESVLVASALIATVTFAAAFTMPGSYKLGGNPKAGTPELGSRYGFKVFLVADIFAFYCSVAATFSLAEYVRRANVDPLVRHTYTKRAIWLFHIALKSVIVAFALGVSVVMWDISVIATIVASTVAFAVVLYGNEALAHDLRFMRVMYCRFGLSRSWELHPSTSSHLDWNTWWLRSFSATLAWNIVMLFWTYGLIFLVAYLAQLRQKDGN